MATIQHKDIPDAQLHEPKGILSATNKQVYIANGSGAGLWRKVNELDIDYSNKSNNLFGWNDIADNQYTSGSPLAIAATTRTLIPNNGLSSQTDTTRLGSIWDTTNKQFLINDLNALYLVRLNCKVKAAAAAGTPYIVKFEMESSSGPTVVTSTDCFLKGGSYENSIAHNFIYCNVASINNQPLKLYITADTAISLYSIDFVVQRLYKET